MRRRLTKSSGSIDKATDTLFLQLMVSEPHHLPVHLFHYFFFFFFPPSFLRAHHPHSYTNNTDKTIKLWKVHEKKVKNVLSTNIPTNGVTPAKGAPAISALKVSNACNGYIHSHHHPLFSFTLSWILWWVLSLYYDLYSFTLSPQIPRVQVRDTIVTATGRRVYANAHAYHINSISVNSDGETYISSDDLRINLWNLAVSDQSFSILFFCSLTIFSLPLSHLLSLTSRLVLSSLSQTHFCFDHVRHCWYQASQHGGVDRGHYLSWIPPPTL